jgi:RNA polymerase sigma factor (TIGR02999 family)
MQEDALSLVQVAKESSLTASSYFPAAYKQLRKLAVQKLANEKDGHTLQPTALVHEAYLRLIAHPDGERGREPNWASRGQFLAAAAEAMRRILVENARRKGRIKHGGGRQRVDLTEEDAAVQPRAAEILALDEALTQLAAEDPGAARVVQLHFFGGLSIEKAAEELGISRATAYREWAYARAWLGCAIGAAAADADADANPQKNE